MPEIEITEDQLAALEALREALAEEHVGAYGTVRMQDAIQFLIDRHDGDVAGLEAESTGDEAAADEVEESGRDAAEDGDVDAEAEDGDGGAEEGDGADGEDGSDVEADADAGTTNGGPSGPGRLQAMMQLLDEHDDKWEQADSEQGKYAVTLPDGETEHVRTKDDVRGLLFKHYN